MNKENYQIIREIAYNLPNPDRDIIMLYLGFYYGKSYNKNEIADMLSISQSTVSKLIGKNLKIIKKHLIKEGLIKEEIKNIKEIREYLEEHPSITYYTKINDRMQTTGGKIGSYLQEYKEEIIEISKENSDAKYICDYFGWLEKKETKKGKLKEENLKEIRNYLKGRSDITNYRKISDKTQTTGSMIGNYLYKHKEKIKEISDKNSDAKYICNYFGWNITKEDILKEIKKYLEEHPGITSYCKIYDKMQTTGGKIGNYLLAHKEKIKEISDKNSDAKYICDYFGWLEKKVTKEDILKEIRRYLEEHLGITNSAKIDDKMQTTGGKIGNYLSKNKEKIKEISNENSDAKYICDYFGWLEKKVTKEDILKEIRRYLEEHLGITNSAKIDDKMQTTGGKIGNYLSKNKEKIKEISNENSDAKYICEYFNWMIYSDSEYNPLDDKYKNIQENSIK